MYEYKIKVRYQPDVIKSCLLHNIRFFRNEATPDVLILVSGTPRQTRQIKEWFKDILINE